MDEGDSTNGAKPPPEYMPGWIGHRMYLQE